MAIPRAAAGVLQREFIFHKVPSRHERVNEGVRFGSSVPAEHGSGKLQGVLNVIIQLRVTGGSLEIAPDSDIRADRASHLHERFHDDRAFISDVSQRFADLTPWNPPLSWNATIAFARMEMTQITACETDCPAKAVFFDVHVEGVEHEPDGRSIDLLDELDSLCSGVHEVAFDARAQSPGLSIGRE